MKITAIKQQLKRADRFSVYVDGKYSFALSERELVNLGIRQDQEVSATELQKLQGQAVNDKAYERCLRYIGIRPRSAWEITTYLQQKGYAPNIIATNLRKLRKVDLINDAAFANQWVQWRLNSGRSRRQLQAELAKKRVSREVIDDVLAEIGEDTELEQLKSIIERKRRQTQYQDHQKLMAYLARRGFSYDLIKKALGKLS